MHKTFLVIISITFSVFVYFWQQNTSVRFAYKISSLQADYNKINAENDILRLKINSILALDKMYKIASEKGLSRLDEKSIVYIS
jgi:cell division protein FtsL